MSEATREPWEARFSGMLDWTVSLLFLLSTVIALYASVIRSLGHLTVALMLAFLAFALRVRIRAALAKSAAAQPDTNPKGAPQCRE